ncbi:MAG: methionyl-tRNA formyltransferase [bacterium]|nr:methionyl-tRNA formyltransferase [bacterium]
MKIVFFGTSEFGVIILEKLVQAHLMPVLVVTTPDKPAGRKQALTPPPVKLFAKTQGLEVFQPAKLDQAAIRFVQEKNPNLFVIAAYGKILPKALLNIPQKGSLNVHPSLLPKYRGSSPVQAVLLNGDEETGVSIIVLDEDMDHGPIVAVERFGIQKKYVYPELHNALAELGGDLLIRTIPLWIEGKIQTQAQDDSKATYASHITKEDGKIDWNKEAGYIERQVRALYPWPGTFTTGEIDGKQRIMKILKASVMSQDRPIGKPGQAFPPPLPGIAVQTRKDALLLEELQLEGGKPMSSKEFLLGHKNFIGTNLK